MGKVLKNIIITSMLLGTIAVGLVWIFGNNTSVLISKDFVDRGTLTWYKFDTYKYIDNLVTQLNKAPQLALDLPTRHWRALEGVDWYEDLGNNLALMLDYVILIINVLLYPLRIGGYLLNFVIAILGINVDNTSSLNWLGIFAQRLIQLSIPYI